MGIIAWIRARAIAGYVATRLVGGVKDILQTVILGTVGALVGGFVATSVLHAGSVNGLNPESILIVNPRGYGRARHLARPAGSRPWLDCLGRTHLRVQPMNMNGDKTWTIQQPGPGVTQGQRPVVIQEQPPVVIQEQRTVATTTLPGNKEFARRFVVFVFGIVQAAGTILWIVFLLLDVCVVERPGVSGPEHQPGLRRPIRGAPAHQRPDLGWRCPRHIAATWSRSSAGRSSNCC